MFLGYFLVSALEHSFSLGVQNNLRLSFHAEGYIFFGGGPYCASGIGELGTGLCFQPNLKFF